MNVYRASYNDTWPYGGFDEIECIIVANTEKEALGIALEYKEKSTAKGWEITKIETNVISLLETYRHSS